MAKDKSEVLQLIKVAVQIDNLATKQDQIMIDVEDQFTSPEVRKDLEQLAEAIGNLQTVLNQIYYNNISE